MTIKVAISVYYQNRPPSRLLWATLLGSGFVHALFFCSTIPWPQWQPPARTVIHAQLQAPAPSYPTLTHSTAATDPKTATSITAKANTTSTRAPVITSTHAPRLVSPPNTAPATQTAAAADKRIMSKAVQEHAGLAISQEIDAIDPLEQQYQQQLLAHLRSKVVAPAELNGSVRLALQFRYRQVATQIQVLQSSGDPRLDDWAVKAVMAANPFPPLPPELPDNFIFRPTLRIAP